MDDNDLEYSDDIIEILEDQCRPIVRHYKNFYNRPRPYQVAEKLGIPFERFKTNKKLQHIQVDIQYNHLLLLNILQDYIHNTEQVL